jgi:hypothetical protein
MRGMAMGIERLSGMVAGTMQSAMAQVAMPAMNLPAVAQSFAVAAQPVASNTFNTNNNFNLTVNSGARTEPIIQDYNMMRSMVGA